jgi:hypothetical protein
MNNAMPARGCRRHTANKSLKIARPADGELDPPRLTAWLGFLAGLGGLVAALRGTHQDELLF